MAFGDGLRGKEKAFGCGQVNPPEGCGLPAYRALESDGIALLWYQGWRRGAKGSSEGGKTGFRVQVQGADGDLPSARTRFAQERGDPGRNQV
jgi:hypothetical protein